MGAVSELYAMRRSFSADRQVTRQSRSGDDQDGGAVVLDFVANVQSAEADIIEAEEREEQAENKREFAALLRAYFKQILTADEYRFLVGCIRQNKTLYQVGRALGVNANKTAEDIENKCKASEKQFFLLMSYSGYDCRRGCEFMARLFNPDAHRRKVRDKIQARREFMREYYRQYRKDHPEKFKEARLRFYAKNPGYAALKTKEYQKTPKGKAKKKELKRLYYKRHPEKAREYARRYRERNIEKERARDRARNRNRNQDPNYKEYNRKYQRRRAAERRAANDQDFIEKRRESNRKYYERKKNDPDFINKRRESCRQSYERKKAAQAKNNQEGV